MFSGPVEDVNKLAIPEMLYWLEKVNYFPKSFNKLRVIHVAGTKGKGSVCAMLDSMLKQYICSQTNPLSYSDDRKILGRVGVFTSPHLVTPRERIRLDGQPISKALFTAYFFEVWDGFTASARADCHPNPEGAESKPGFFRFLTIMALHTFLQQNVQTAIIECGIGGEYDSTNILPKEAITTSVITRLGIDHVAMLGNTIGQIAWNKAGIMRSGVPCFTVPQPEEAMIVLRNRAKDAHTNVTVVNRRSELINDELQLNLEGDYQKDNASLAIEALDCHFKALGLGAIFADREAEFPLEIRRGLADVSWPGRCQVIHEKNIEWLIDGAHTNESVAEVALWFSRRRDANEGPSGILIFNSQLRNGSELVVKLHTYLKVATGGVGEVFEDAFFPANIAFEKDVPSPSPELTVQRETAFAWQHVQGGGKTRVFRTIESAMREARDLAETRYPQKIQVLVTGSLYLVGGFLKVIQRDVSGIEES
jgi:folylpolyglutamate synthase